MDTKCSIPTCEGKHLAKGYCQNHYYRLRKYGDATIVKQVQFHGMSLKERFFKYVKKTESCWLWVGGKNNGYGTLNIDGIPRLAPRISWEMHHGGIPTGKFILHKCDTPACVNPDHLYVGDQKQNMADMWGRGRANPGLVQGSKHGMSKLTEEQVREIRRAKTSVSELAAKYSISCTTVAQVIKRQTWKHVKEE